MPGEAAANENRLRLTPVTSPLCFGITLSNRGALLGLTMPRELLRMADVAESCPLIDSVWVGGVLYSHINVKRDSDAALADSKLFLDRCYGANDTHERFKAWRVFGNGRQIICILRAFRGSCWRRGTFSVSTMKNPFEQLRRVIEEVLPAVNVGTFEPNAI